MAGKSFESRIVARFENTGLLQQNKEVEEANKKMEAYGKALVNSVNPTHALRRGVEEVTDKLKIFGDKGNEVASQINKIIDPTKRAAAAQAAYARMSVLSTSRLGRFGDAMAKARSRLAEFQAAIGPVGMAIGVALVAAVGAAAIAIGKTLVDSLSKFIEQSVATKESVDVLGKSMTGLQVEIGRSISNWAKLDTSLLGLARLMDRITRGWPVMIDALSKLDRVALTSRGYFALTSQLRKMHFEVRAIIDLLSEYGEEERARLNEKRYKDTAKKALELYKKARQEGMRIQREAQAESAKLWKEGNDLLNEALAEETRLRQEVFERRGRQGPLLPNQGFDAPLTKAKELKGEIITLAKAYDLAHRRLQGLVTTQWKSAAYFSDTTLRLTASITQAKTWLPLQWKMASAWSQMTARVKVHAGVMKGLAAGTEAAGKKWLAAVKKASSGVGDALKKTTDKLEAQFDRQMEILGAGWVTLVGDMSSAFGEFLLKVGEGGAAWDDFANASMRALGRIASYWGSFMLLWGMASTPIPGLNLGSGQAIAAGAALMALGGALSYIGGRDGGGGGGGGTPSTSVTDLARGMFDARDEPQDISVNVYVMGNQVRDPIFEVIRRGIRTGHLNFGGA